jgi:hypothetical protein
VGPALGGLLLAGAPFALWPLAAGVCLVAAAGAVSLERAVPPEHRRIPHAVHETEELEPAQLGIGHPG